MMRKNTDRRFNGPAAGQDRAHRVLHVLQREGRVLVGQEKQVRVDTDLPSDQATQVGVGEVGEPSREQRGEPPDHRHEEAGDPEEDQHDELRDGEDDAEDHRHPPLRRCPRDTTSRHASSAWTWKRSSCHPLGRPPPAGRRFSRNARAWARGAAVMSPYVDSRISPPRWSRPCTQPPPVPRPASERSVQRVDQRTVARALPTGDDMVHDVAERHAARRVGEADRSPGAEVAEAARVGAEGTTRHRGFEAEPEGDVLVEDRAVAARLRRRRLGQQVAARGGDRARAAPRTGAPRPGPSRARSSTGPPRCATPPC